MGKLNWPMLSRDRPKDVVEHANALKDDFKALHDHVKKLKASKRHLAKLPSGYKSKISKGIILGVTEAITNEYYPKFISDIDQDLFCKTLLQTIRSELITEVHDRIPLLEFDTLHNSYKELVKKLPSYLALDLRNRAMTPNSDLEQNRGNGSRPPTSHTINQAAILDCDNEDSEVEMQIDEDAHDILRTLQTIEDQGTLLGHQFEFLDEYTEDLGVPEIALGPGGNAMDDSEEGLDGVQAEDPEKAEEREIEKDVGDSAIVKDGGREANAVDGSYHLQDGDAGANSMRGFDRGKGSRKTKQSYGHPPQQETFILQDVPAFVNNGLTTASSAVVTFKIKHQATVNRLVLATSQKILDHLYRSLRRIIATQERLTDWIHLSEPRVVDDGDVAFRANTESEDLFRPAPMNAWVAEFEAGISPQGPAFKLELPAPNTNSINIATRKGKAEVIHELTDLNNHRLSTLHGDSNIIDLAWNPHMNRKQPTSLLIEFSNSQLAQQVLQQGLAWQGIIHKCQKIPLKFSLPRCGRCQAYGHLDGECSAAYCCGTCAEAHPTKDCTSPNKRCAVCGGPHPAKSAMCPVKKAERKKTRFATPESIAHNGKREPATVRSDVEKAGTMEGPNLPPSTSALAASPKNTDIDDEQLRLTRCGRCQGYGHVASKCSARLRCGKCALHHYTWKCRSTFARCAVCNGDHIASSAICPARPQDKARSQQLRKSERPGPPPLHTPTPNPYPQEPETKLEPQPEPYLQQPEIKSEPQSPSPGVAACLKRTPKKRSMLAQVGELIQVVSKGNSREMASIKNHLETLESAMIAEGGDIVAMTPRAGKRRAQEALMSGALQDRSGSPKRVKV